ncbi:hypothetical protein [Microbacterium sp. MM2322]|uniref:hypothetical protein n=1 Tax=Microbacterium sp. MM2322 TaxID=3157631 RepID=UPI0032D5A130
MESPSYRLTSNQYAQTLEAALNAHREHTASDDPSNAGAAAVEAGMDATRALGELLPPAPELWDLSRKPQRLPVALTTLIGGGIGFLAAMIVPGDIGVRALSGGLAFVSVMTAATVFTPLKSKGEQIAVSVISLVTIALSAVIASVFSA